jgi:O-antigen ligase
VSDDTSNPLDVGAFFNRPPPPAWPWIQSALLCAVLVALALFVEFGDDARTARRLGFTAYLSIAAGVFHAAWARYTERADALRRQDRERTAKRTREWMAFFRKWRERRERRGV